MRFFLSPAGRLTRRNWWTYAVPAMAAAFVLAGLLDVLLFSGFFVFGPARVVIGALLLWPSLALISRRLHDLNLSAALMAPYALFLALGPIFFVAGVYGAGSAFNMISSLGMTIFTAAVAITGATLLGVGLAPGQRAPNRHGPDPLAT